MPYLIFTIAIAFLWVLFVVLSFLPRRRQEVVGEVAMEAKVIYSDGSFGAVDVSRLHDLTEESKIAAYQVYHRWVEVRRRQVSDPNYQGQERRKSYFIIL
jgi:hypothetical protein